MAGSVGEFIVGKLSLLSARPTRTQPRVVTRTRRMAITPGNCSVAARPGSLSEMLHCAAAARVSDHAAVAVT